MKWLDLFAIGGAIVLIGCLSYEPTPPAPVKPPVLADSLWSWQIGMLAQSCVYEATLKSKDSKDYAEIERLFSKCLLDSGVVI